MFEIAPLKSLDSPPKESLAVTLSGVSSKSNLPHNRFQDQEEDI
jgi:hypothetical protein